MRHDYTDVIVAKLSVMARGTNNIYKTRAYTKVIAQIKALSHGVRSWDDLQSIEGIGKGIREKIDEIFLTGTLKAAEQQRPCELLKVYGIGTVKARELETRYGISTISQLRERPNVLNDKQRIGLKYVEDLQLRISRKEMLAHEHLIQEVVASVHPEFNMHLVGSFRRHAHDSGDIDVLLRLPAKYDSEFVATKFREVCETMVQQRYIIDLLALGNSKCMGICRLRKGMPARRIDILVTPYHEYPYALLYFTGSDRFNIGMRRIAADQGYSLSEHGLKKINPKAKDVPVMHNEKDIFEFLEYPYRSPSKR